MFPLFVFYILSFIKTKEYKYILPLCFIYLLLFAFIIIIGEQRPFLYEDNFVYSYKPIPVNMVKHETEIDDYIYSNEYELYLYQPRSMIHTYNGNIDHDIIKYYVYKPKIYFYIFTPLYALAMRNRSIHEYNKSTKINNNMHIPKEKVINKDQLIVE